MNKLFLIGNLTRDPELSETQNGTAYCLLNIAVNRGYSDKDGNKITDFFRVSVWRKQAENCGRYLKKGGKVAVTGELQSRSYEDKDGNKKTVTDIVAVDIEFLSPTNKKDESPQLEICEEDLPF